MIQALGILKKCAALANKSLKEGMREGTADDGSPQQVTDARRGASSTVNVHVEEKGSS